MSTTNRNLCDEGVSGLMREQELSAALFNISTIINSSDNFEEIMRLVLMESAKATGNDASAVALRKDNHWYMKHGYNLPEELMGRFFSDEELPGAATAAKTKKPATAADALHARPANPEMMTALNAGSGLAVPLIARGKTIGCLFLSNLSPKAASDDIGVKFAERAGALISLALDKAALLEERERLVEQVAEEKARFDVVLEEMPAGVIIAEAPSGKLIRGNEQVERILRGPFLKAAEAGDYTGYKGFYPDGRPYQMEEWPLARSLTKGEMVTGEEIRLVRGDGTEGAVSVSSAPIRDIRGRIIAGIAIFTDISDRRQAEEAVRDSESKFRNIASAAQDAVILIDNDGQVGFWNNAATKIFGYTSEEMMGKHLHSFIMPERYREEHVRGFEAFRLTGQGRFIEKTYEIEAKKKDGTEFPIELSLASLKLKDKWNSIGIVRDITARKRAEEELKRTVEELERSNKELQQFAYAASHDLKEPLRTVGSFVELLSRKYAGKLDEKADKYIAYAIDGARRMSVLIDDLLTYSRVGTQGKQFDTVPMGPVLTQAMADLKMSIEENQASIDFKDLPTVNGDGSQLVQLLQNLLGNAMKFRKKDVPPRIHVFAERRGNEWVFGVRDNGIGIDPRFHEQIFAIFQRLHTREEYAGTGIGLAICKKIVERHGGRIWVDSKPGDGSSFYFTLPFGEGNYGAN
jgi:PAS domain S-box-containing protein